MPGKLLLLEIRDLIASGDLTTLGEPLNRWSPADWVDAFDQLSDEEVLAGMQMISRPLKRLLTDLFGSTRISARASGGTRFQILTGSGNYSVIPRS